MVNVEKKVVDLLVEKCSKNIDENEVIYNGTLNASLSDYKCNSCILCIALFVILVTSIVISSVFIYFHWYLKKYPKNLLRV